MFRLFCGLGSFLGALGVIAGAFGAHALKTRLTPEMLAVFETAVRYHLIHALALVLVGVVSQFWASKLIAVSGWFFFGGILIFSGSLYILTLTGVKAWGAITPLGGLGLIIGWILLTVSCFKS